VTSIVAGGSQGYAGGGGDRDENSLGDVTAGTTFTIAPDGACTGASCTASVGGSHPVAGSDGGQTGTATPSVGAAAVGHILISPDSTSIAAGGAQTYTAEAIDASGNALGDVTDSTNFTITDGSCSGNVCTSTVAGAHTVIGTSAANSDSADLPVLPAPPRPPPRPPRAPRRRPPGPPPPGAGPVRRPPRGPARAHHPPRPPPRAPPPPPPPPPASTATTPSAPAPPTRPAAPLFGSPPPA